MEEYYYDLKPGCYEVDVEGHYLAKDTSSYNFKIQFYGINCLDDKIIDGTNDQIEVVNLFNKAENYNLTGKISGYEINRKITISGNEKFRMPFVLRNGEQSKEFKLELSKEDYNKLTDLAFIIYDSEGVDINNDALGYRTGIIRINNSSDADSVEYVFEIVPGFAQGSSSADIHLTETTTFGTEHSINVVSERRPAVTLYPSLPKQLQIYFDVPNEYFPDEFTTDWENILLNLRQLKKQNMNYQLNSNSKRNHYE